MTRNEILKQRRVDYFKKHCKMIQENQRLLKSINNSVTLGRVYDDIIFDPKNNKCPIKSEEYNIQVIPLTTIHATNLIHSAFSPYSKIAILNFASATHPGGYVVGGSSAQEESICRSSTLYQVLSDSKFSEDYYQYNKKYGTDTYENGEPYHKYTDRIIYTPDVTIMASDSVNLDILPIYISEQNWFNVDVITCPAPNLIPLWKKYNGYVDVDASSNSDGIATTIRDAYDARIAKMLKLAIMHNVDYLILGAWGCGVFKNRPIDIAVEFHKYLVSCEYYKYFKRVYFAVIDDYRSVSSPYKVFRNIFSTEL